MKKKLIAAGAASLAVAAMPVVGVFAAEPVTKPDTHTDILSVTIDKVCAFGYDSDTSNENSTIEVTGITRANGSGSPAVGTWGTATVNGTTGNTTNTLSGTMINGTYDDDFGSTTLGVYCNNENGYKITSAFVEGDGTTLSTHSGALTATGINDTIPTTTSIAANAATGWSYKVEDAAEQGNTNVGQIQTGFGSWASTAGIIVSAPTTSGASKMTTNDGDYFKITYGVVIDESQSAGTYTGGITYTLAQL